MSGIKVENLKLVRANQAHFQDICNFSKGIYNGLDYFCGIYSTWLEEEAETDQQKRRSVVLVDENGRALGFQSFMVQDGGRRVLAQALRIDQSLTGIGLGRAFMRMCREFLAEWNKEFIEVKTLWGSVVPKEKLTDQSMGTICGSRITRNYRVGDVEEFCQKYKDDALTEKHDLSFGPGDELAELFSTHPEKFKERFLSNGYLPILWIPYFVSKEEHLKGIASLGGSINLLSNPSQNGDLLASISVFSAPYKVEAGTAFGVDLFVESEEDFEIHVRVCLSKIAGILSNKSAMALFDTERPGHKTFLWFAADENFHPFLDRHLDGIFKRQQLPGQGENPTEDKKPEYFIMEKKI